VSDIRYPITLDVLIPDGVVLSPACLGAMILLGRAAWYSDPPCTLTHDPGRLLRLAGVSWTTPDVRERAWSRIWSEISPACSITPDGLLRFDTLALAYRAALEEQAARRRRTAAATIARTGNTPRSDHAGTEPASTSRSRDDDVTMTLRHRHVAPGEVRAQSAQRSIHTDERAPSAERLALIGPGSREAADEAESRAMVRHWLTEARWPWARQERQRYLSARLVDRLVSCEHATPERVLYVLSQIAAMHRDGERGGRPPGNPVGIVIAALGANDIGAVRPWGVPLAYLPEARREIERWRERRGAGTSIVAAIESVRERRAEVRREAL